MRLLLIIPELSLKTPGGIATYYRNLIPMLREQVASIDVLVANPFGNAEELWSCEGVTVDQVPDENLARYRSRFAHMNLFPQLTCSLASAWAAHDYVRDAGKFDPGHFDLVNVVDWGLAFIPWILESRHLPLVVTMHGSAGQISAHDPIAEYELEGYMTRLIEKSFLSSADGLLTHSPGNASFWERTVESDVKFILPAIEAEGVRGRELSAEGLVVGRLQKWKDPKVVCRALEVLKDDKLKIRWVGRETATLRKDVAMGDVLTDEFPQVFGSSLLHQPSLPYEKVRILQTSSAFNLIPSSWDVFNFTVVESLLSGRPTICSSGAGASCLIKHGENGFLFPSGDAEALASVITEARNLSEEAVQSMADVAFATVSEELCPKKIANQTAHYFAGILSKKRESKPGDHQEWLADFVSPDGSSSSVADVLENLSLKTLLAYVTQRAKRKWFRG